MSQKHPFYSNQTTSLPDPHHATEIDWEFPLLPTPPLTDTYREAQTYVSENRGTTLSTPTDTYHEAQTLLDHTETTSDPAATEPIHEHPIRIHLAHAFAAYQNNCAPTLQRPIPSVAHVKQETQASLPNENKKPTMPHNKKYIAGRYKILQSLGEGAYARVYKAIDTELNETIALKLLFSDVGQQQEHLARFRREVLLSHRVTHRNIARVHDIGKHNGAYFLTMEWIDGTTLAQWIEKQPLPPVAECLDIAVQICEGLAAIHRLGILHRDLKPENIMIDKEGRAVVTDFGIARQEADQDVFKTNKAEVFATPAYMSPEQIKCAPSLDLKADLYSLGVILYEMLCKASPHPSEDLRGMLLKRISSPPPNPRLLRPELPPSLASLVQQCMALQPQDRPRDAHELQMKLQHEKKCLSPQKKSSSFLSLFKKLFVA